MKPFLKWAGGKRWLTHRFKNFENLDFNKYIEPFLGGGAVFFDLLPERSNLSDSNTKLICTYNALKANSRHVIKKLEAYAENHTSEHYYNVRSAVFSDPFDIAAQFIYLNRTCWNGLYRENLSGVFNVPKGTKSKVVYEDDDFEKVEFVLRNALLDCCDFQIGIESAASGDLIFADPPYTVKHNNNGFVKYNERIFSWDDQIRLRNAISFASKNGARAIVTNAYHPSIIELYSNVGEIVPLDRYSVLSNDKKFRSPTQEAVIFIGIDPADVLIHEKSRIHIPDQIMEVM